MFQGAVGVTVSGRTVSSSALAQTVLGDSDDAAEHMNAMQEATALVLKQIGGIEAIRKPKSVYPFFKNITHKSIGGQQLQGNCMFCGTSVISTAATRLIQHLKGCPRCPRDVQLAFSKLIESTGVKRKEKAHQLVLAHEEADRELKHVKAQKLELRQQGIKAGFQVGESTVADIAIAKFFYANGISFSAACPEGDSYYKEMIRAIKAAPDSYVPPNRNALSGKLLDVCEDLLAKEIANRDPDGNLAMKFGRTYTQDGWDSVDHLPLINSAYITANDGGVYLRSVDTSGHTKCAEYIAGLMIQDIYSIGCTSVVLVVTDTCNVMKKAWSYVLDEFPWISTIPCLPHVTSLLMKDIGSIKEVDTLIKEESTVVSWYIINRALLRTRIRAIPHTVSRHNVRSGSPITRSR